MNSDSSMTGFFDSWKKQRIQNIMSTQRTMKEKILREFKKISKEDLLGRSIDDVFQLVFFDKTDTPLYRHITWPTFEPALDSHLTETMTHFYEEAMVINEDGFNLMTFIEFLLNNYDDRYLYWCSYPQISQDILEKADTYHFTLIRFHRDRFETNFNVQEELHPFIKSLSHIWSSQYKEKNYDNCFRKAASSMNELIGSIWDTLNILSSLKYEGSNNNGGLVFIENYTPYLVLTLEAPVPLTQHRSIRKLLQMSRKGHYLLINEDNIAIGFGNIITLKPLFRVSFMDHLSWRLFLGQQEFLSCTNLLPMLPNTGSDLHRLKEQLTRTFKDMPCHMDRIIAVIQAAKQQSKGTMIVVSENAAKESKRLESSSIIIKPIELTTSQVQLVTSIDGAVIMDNLGTCHAIGSILDGYATDNGDPSRGARYNSALRYINSQSETRCMIVVVSEDRYIDILTSQ